MGKLTEHDSMNYRLNAMNIAMDGSRGKAWQIDEIIENARKIEDFLKGTPKTKPEILTESSEK